MGIHGGDIYNHPNVLDFSANCNCYGMPERVREAAIRGVQSAASYPDSEWRALREAIADYEGVEKSQIVCGNGASELLLALAMALQPKRAFLTAPCFLEYERVLKLVGAQIEWQSGEDFLERLQATDAELVILSNPNNPTGELLMPQTVRQMVDIVEARGMDLVVDECFLDFLEDAEAYSCKQYLKSSPHLMVLKAFTKTFACAGLRLGYLLSANTDALCNCKKYLPEWNVSLPATYAGIAATKEREWLRETSQKIRAEREWLRGKLEALGFQVCSGAANFLFFTGKAGLYEHCLTQGILIRDCSNYHGLGAGAYRVCVKKRAENEKLLAAIQSWSGCC